MPMTVGERKQFSLYTASATQTLNSKVYISNSFLLKPLMQFLLVFGNVHTCEPLSQVIWNTLKQFWYTETILCASIFSILKMSENEVPQNLK